MQMKRRRPADGSEIGVRMGGGDRDVGHFYDYCNNLWICNGLGWEEKEMSLIALVKKTQVTDEEGWDEL